jgi:hypothetical protein
MNPHIKQLLESAPFTTISTEGRLFTQEDVAVFAEALVRECADQVDDYFSDFYNRTAADKIKEHFGVE